MTANKHTPWRVRKHKTNSYGDTTLCSFAIERSDGLQIATVVSDCIEDHEANARLIAAAPDLLQCLKWMVALRRSETMPASGAEYCASLVAISKATGGQP